MRVLITAAPFRGHLNAVLPLAQAARRAGHEVVVATGGDLADEVSRRGLAAWPVGPTNAESGMPRSLSDFWTSGAQRAVDLMPRAERWRPDVVIAEELEVAGAIVAARLRTRYVVHGLGIAAAGDPGSYAADLAALGRDWDVPHLDELHLTAPLLSSCPALLQPSYGFHRDVLAVRPGIGEPQPGERLPAVLDTLPHRETIHLTLGTVFNERHPEVMAAAIAGLSELPLNLVVTVGPRVPADRFGPQPGHVVITSHVPHSLLLPRCRLVVSQGGAGIVFGALAHGLPQLVLPQGADQFLNGAAVARAGVGLVLEATETTPDAIADAVQRLRADAAYTEAAQRAREEIAAMPTAEDVVRTVLEVREPLDRPAGARVRGR